MMFPWNIARSAEAIFSRWALKRVCKFLLKKKLGKFILGEVDLDQLDVQLSDGTIQLSDLALNVDYLNEKLGAAASLIIKEGSIGSLLVRMPWKGKGCQVEVDELEVVLAPRLRSNSSSGNGTCSTSQDGPHTIHHDVGKPGHDALDSATTSTSSDVHEGVKTIAKMVKWFLTSFHVKIKNLIVALDPNLEKDETEAATCTTLVLRITEIECGTCVSEESSSSNSSKIESFLGISKLMNFVKFQGAILELLRMDNVDGRTSLDEKFTGYCPSNAATPIAVGKEGGISGSLKLSIPWNDGSLDIRRINADVYVDPLKLRFQPIILKWFLLSWEVLKNLANDGRAHTSCKTAESVYFNSASHFHSSAIPTNQDVHIGGTISTNLYAPNSEELVTGTTPPGSHLIHDWVPRSVSYKQNVGTEDVDFGASMDQFFECFDGIRSCQSALGSSGMWNWTSSVFTAITAASSLASGSLHVPSEQQHIQTDLRATIAGISIVLSFHDDGDQAHDVMDANYVAAECRGLFVAMQVRPWEMSLEGTMKYVEVAHYLCSENDVMNFDFQGSVGDIKCETYWIKNLQAEVEDTLPPFPSSAEGPDLDRLSGLVADAFLSGKKGNAVKTLLLRSSGVTQCQVTIDSRLSDGSLRRPTLFSLNLPPFIFWLNFHLINMLLNLFKEVGKSIERSSKKNGFLDQGCREKHDPFQGDGHLQIRTLHSTDSFRGNISIPNARLILCFPFESGKEIGGSFCWNQFIALDFASSKTSKEKIQGSPVLDGCPQGRTFSPSAMHSLHLNVGNLSIYLVTSACEDDVENNSSSSLRKLSAHKVLSVSNESACLSVINMFWQEGPVTGTWVAEKAKSLATSGDSKNRNKVGGKGYEFAITTATRDPEDVYSLTREEIIFSSSFFLHIRLFPVKIHIGSSHYAKLLSLIDHVKCRLSSAAYDESSGREEYSLNQTSILLECDSVEILVRLENKENTNDLLQNELPGSWYCLKLIVQKFDLLLVSNIGGICGADFFWLAHGEGKLWGSVTGVWDKEFLLISCSNSTIKRGDGGGSNALSSRLAGSDIVHLWEPETSRGYTSVTLRCSTIVAVGGRLDWLQAITSFFNMPSPETDQAVDKHQQEGCSDAPHGASFILNFVDIGLSYEPHFKSLLLHSEVLDSDFSPANVKEEISAEIYVGCLLAASSLTVSNVVAADCVNGDYKIKVQDLGLLLCTVTDPERLGGTYSVEYLCEYGYVKVAREALVEATLRTNCENGILWKVECSKSHIYVETCNDTTSGLIRLGAQLQKLYAPNVEETIVHLQTRWNNVQQAKERNDSNDKAGNFNDDLASQMLNTSIDAKRESGVIGLMDEISEDAFNLDGTQTCQFDSSDSKLHASQDGIFLGEACNLSFDTSEIFSHNLSVNGSALAIGVESSQTSFLENDCSPELIESYCLSELRPLSELSAGRELSRRHRNLGDGDLERRTTGWYGDASFRIVENHISKTSDLNCMTKVKECMTSSVEGARPDDFGNALGRVLVKNVNVIWRMYAGSDWHDSQKDNESSTDIHGRDTTVCLELELSGLQCQYDLFPVGGICSSKLSLSIQDFHLYDRSKAAPWQLVLGYYNSKDHPRESFSKAFKLDIDAVRPDPLIPLEEYRLRIAFLPMLLHLHQSQLDFLISFFGPKSLAVDQSSGCAQDSGASKLVLTERVDPAGHHVIEEALLPYFQKFDIWPFLVRVDYSPHRVDLAALGAGKYVELVNLVPWKGIELQLKHVHAAGIYGWGNVCETIVGEWLEDISQNQIHKIVRGIPTIRSLFAVGDGAAKLVSLPVASYRKDQRVLKGLQRGTIAFLRSISLEAVGLGVHLAAGFHDLLLKAEYVVTSIPPSLSLPSATTKANVRYNQPRDAQEGIRQAYERISNGLGKSASALVQTPLKRYQRGASAGSALATAVQAVPTAAILPASACASAVHCAFLGFRNSLDPERKKESMEKYLGPNQARNQS